jgi:copper chaperone CopZ
MKQELEIQNLKCGGCATTITKELQKIGGISDVSVNEENDTVAFNSVSEDISPVVDRLKQLGYPVAEAENSIFSKATSYVSCVRGRVN